MSRVLFAPLGSLGDLHPVIALALKMRERGHSVAICTSPFYQAKLEALGFEFHPMRPDLAPDTPEMRRWSAEIMDPRRGADLLLRGFLFPALRETYEDLSRAVASGGGADLLVSGEIVYAAPLVAERTGIRWASFVLSPMSFFSVHDFPILPPVPRLSAFLRACGPAVRRAALRVMKRVTRSWGRPVAELRAQLGLRPGGDPLDEGKHSPELVLAMFSSQFAQRRPDWPPNTEITGFCFYDAAESPEVPALEQFLRAGEPPIVFTLGSAAVYDPGSFYEESARAAALLKKRALLLAGPNELPRPRDNQIAVFEYLPYSKVFPRAAAAVHQGGIGTTAQSLRAGRPMLVMPFGFDQPDNADRAVRLGVARKISRGAYSARRVAAELRELLGNAAIQTRAAELSRKISEEDGPDRAADALERLLRSDRIAPRPDRLKREKPLPTSCPA